MNLSDLLPGSGGSVASIQTIKFLFANPWAAEEDITIAAVDPAKTLVLMSQRVTNTATLAAATLLNATTVRVTKGGEGSHYSNSTHSITVIDFGGLAKSVQRGSVGGTGVANQTITIGAVNPAKCIVVTQHAKNIDYIEVEGNSYAAITNANTLTLGMAQAGRTVHWQVLEFQ